MSKELTVNGTIAGSAEYFKKINETEALGEITSSLANYAYYDMLEKLVPKIQRATDDIYRDLSKNPRVLMFVLKQDRDRLLKFISNLEELAKYAGKSVSKASSCKSLLELKDSKTNLKSRVSISVIQKAAKLIKDGEGVSLSKSERIDTVNAAKSRGVNQAAGNNPKKTAFLMQLLQGNRPDADFFDDVLLVFSYSDSPSKFFNPMLGSADYIERAERNVFIRPQKLSINKNSKSYATLLKESFQNIAKKIESDLNQGARNNDYVKDNTADALKKAFVQLEKCGVKCSGINGKIDKLAWFVGGDPSKIKELQRNLNELGIQGSSGRLLEDGVYGKETLAAWNSFYNKLVDGTVPSLNWIDYGLKITSGDGGINNALSGSDNFPYLRIDSPHLAKSGLPKNAKVNGKWIPMDYNHINVDFPKPRTKLQNEIINRYNHHPLSDGAYNKLKNFDGIAKKVKVAGKVLLVAGIALDVLELGITIDADLKDADKKLGKKTISTAARIGGRWVGAISGAKVGAMGGAAIGAPLGPVGSAVGATAGALVLGISGAFAGDKLAEWVVDVTIVEE